MPTLRSSVLIVGAVESTMVGFGADFAPTFGEARQALNEFSYPVLALISTHADSDEVLMTLHHANRVSPYSQRVIIQNDTSVETIRAMVNLGSIFSVLNDIRDTSFETKVQEALEEHYQLRQNAKLLQLVSEQNERLKKLTAELEERVEARKKSLEDAKERVLISNTRIEALHRALVAIHRAGSIGEMEQLINEALRSALGLLWTRILFQSQARLESLALSNASSVVSLHTTALTRGKETLGHIHFARALERPFTRDETAFLGRVSDAVSLAIDRLTKLEQSETLKQQWEATFDAIADPVTLIASDYTVVRSNRSFIEQAAGNPSAVIGQKCYTALFGRSSPCDGCAIATRGSNFRLKPSRTVSAQNVIYDVFSQVISQDDQQLFVNMYHDVSSQLRFERQILENAKMAELGTIGSSIAHELNNPLGGMLSFLQLIKMDLKGDEPYYNDIIDMEKGAQRCRDIVHSLLGFTRKSANDGVDEKINIADVIAQALKITELQTRAAGITVIQDLPDETIEIRGDANSLAQAIRHFLQGAQDSIARRQSFERATSVAYTGEIHVSVFLGLEWITIEIRDNGDMKDSAVDAVVNVTNENLTATNQIISQHGGRIELRADKSLGNTAIISIPRPVFDA